MKWLGNDKKNDNIWSHLFNFLVHPVAGQWDASGYFDSSTKILNLFGLDTAPKGRVGIFTISKHISMVKPRNFIAGIRLAVSFNIITRRKILSI